MFSCIIDDVIRWTPFSSYTVCELRSSLRSFLLPSPLCCTEKRMFKFMYPLLWTKLASIHTDHTRMVGWLQMFKRLRAKYGFWRRLVFTLVPWRIEKGRLNPEIICPKNQRHKMFFSHEEGAAHPCAEMTHQQTYNSQELFNLSSCGSIPAWQSDWTNKPSISGLSCLRTGTTRFQLLLFFNLGLLVVWHG